MIRARTDVANARQNLIAARNRVELATAVLNNVLNIDQNTPTGVAEAREPQAEVIQDYDRAVQEAYRARPEALGAQANIRAAEKGVLLARRSSLPALGATWNFSYAPDQGGFSPRDTS